MARTLADSVAWVPTTVLFTVVVLAKLILSAPAVLPSPSVTDAVEAAGTPTVVDGVSPVAVVTEDETPPLAP